MMALFKGSNEQQPYEPFTDVVQNAQRRVLQAGIENATDRDLLLAVAGWQVERFDKMMRQRTLIYAFGPAASVGPVVAALIWFIQSLGV